jgi:deoxyadenosine/deoxycytidine kinase
MTTPGQDLFLIAGIPGTGKTSYGDKFASEFDFVHHDLEDRQALNRFAANPGQFIADVVAQRKNVVITWGFNPQDPPSLELIRQLRNAGFKLIWFDGNREGALVRFEARAKSKSSSMAEYYLRMHEFYQQLYRIEASKIIETLRPVVVDSFDSQGQFKSAADLLEEISQL